MRWAIMIECMVTGNVIRHKGSYANPYTDPDYAYDLCADYNADCERMGIRARAYVVPVTDAR